MAKVDCIKLLRAAGIATDSEARQMLKRMETLARERSIARGIVYDKALADIAGELKLRDGMGRGIDRRNRLLSIGAKQTAREAAKRFESWGKGLEAFLWGNERDIKGAGFGLYQQFQGLWGRYASRFIADLKEADVYDDFIKGRHSKEFYIESGQLGIANGKPGITGNRSAAAMARIYRSVRLEIQARLNELGAWIEEAPGYVLTQTHDRGAIMRLNPTDSIDAFRQWRDFVLPLLDHEKTFGGSDPEKSLREIHQNLYTGNHEKALDTFDVDTFRAHGSLASKISSERVLWFKDAESAWNYNERFGKADYNQAALNSIRQGAKNIALMDRLGPNPVENLKSVVRELRVEAEPRSDSAKQMNSLDPDAFDRRMGVLTGAIDIPANASIQRFNHMIRSFRLLASGGKMVLSSFGDKPFMQSHMTYLGMSQLDSFGRNVAGMIRSSGTAKDMLLKLGIVPQSLTGHVASRWGFEARTGYQVNGWTQKFFDLNGMNWWTEVNQSVMADATVSHLGNHSHLPLAALPDEVTRALRHYDISEGDWDVIRKTAYTISEGPMEGAKVITADAFETIPDGWLDSIIEQRGLAATPINRKRQRELLRNKYEALVIDSVDTGVPTPGAREKYITTLGGRAQAGTWFGEIARDVMMYKSFPITAAMKLVGREMYGTGAQTAKQWLMQGGKGKWRIAQLIASATIAGYMGGVFKDLLAGRTPKPLILDDGEINWPTLQDAALRGGALGIYGDFLFSEYDARGRTILAGLAGPVAGQLDPLAALASKARGLATGQGEADAEKLGYDAWRLAEQNLPFAGLLYVKPVLDYFIFWNIREMLSPGVLLRSEHSVHDRNHQEFYVSPAGSASIPINDPGRKLEYFLESIKE